MTVLEICLIVYIVSAVVLLSFGLFMEGKISKGILVPSLVPIQNTIYAAGMIVVLLWECIDKIEIICYRLFERKQK